MFDGVVMSFCPRPLKHWREALIHCHYIRRPSNTRQHDIICPSPIHLTAFGLHIISFALSPALSCYFPSPLHLPKGAPPFACQSDVRQGSGSGTAAQDSRVYQVSGTVLVGLGKVVFGILGNRTFLVTAVYLSDQGRVWSSLKAGPFLHGSSDLPEFGVKARGNTW